MEQEDYRIGGSEGFEYRMEPLAAYLGGQQSVLQASLKQCLGLGQQHEINDPLDRACYSPHACPSERVLRWIIHALGQVEIDLTYA
jgi:hypothetical protein